MGIGLPCTRISKPDFSNTKQIKQMKVFELGGELREDLGKKASAKLRKEEKIPCVLYGLGKENTNFVVTRESVRKLIYTPEVFEVKIILGKDKRRAVIKEIQYHPVTDAVLHIDFLEVDDVKPIVFKVPVKTEGLAVGVRAGGKLQLDMRKIRVRALCKDIPENITVNVENLEAGKSIKAGELHFDGFDIVDNKESLVVSVKLTRAARSAAASK